MNRYLNVKERRKERESEGGGEEMMSQACILSGVYSGDPVSPVPGLLYSHSGGWWNLPTSL